MGGGALHFFIISYWGHYILQRHKLMKKVFVLLHEELQVCNMIFEYAFWLISLSFELTTMCFVSLGIVACILIFLVYLFPRVSSKEWKTSQRTIRRNNGSTLISCEWFWSNLLPEVHWNILQMTTDCSTDMTFYPCMQGIRNCFSEAVTQHLLWKISGTSASCFAFLRKQSLAWTFSSRHSSCDRKLGKLTVSSIVLLNFIVISDHSSVDRGWCGAVQE